MTIDAGRPAPCRMQIGILPFLLAVLAGEIAFEIYAWLISPILFGATLQPANLVSMLGGMITGTPVAYPTAFVLHFLIGSVGFALTVVATRRITGIHFLWAGALAGFVLWFVAQGVLAPLVGRSFMMGFGAYTQSPFIGHVGMSLVIGSVLARTGPARGQG